MKKIYLTKKFDFSSAHKMFNGDFSEEENNIHFGKCQNMHGHNYFLEVTASGSIDKSKGYFVNLNEMSEAIKSNIINVLDHRYLNDVLPDCKNKPVTIEVISMWIWNTIIQKMPDYDLFKIRLWETENNSVEIYK